LSASTRVRQATAGDAAVIARIHADGIAERVATFETRPPTEAEVERRIASGAIVLLAERGGEVVAFAKIGPYSDPNEYYAGVGEATLYVSRGARRGGIGRALLEALAADAERRGYWKLVGKIFDSNAPSLELVRACGWREVGVHLRHGRLDGHWKDVVVVERLLGEAAS
jgi:L-amino acid N-acyltransferase YncA